ncbi:MAG: T9SS type A sorting domain-containing protein [Bacteroidota bacterium]
MKQVPLLFATLLYCCFGYSATLTVCSSGCDYTTIAAAIAAAAADDIIDIQDGTYTEAALTISKNITIQGQGPASTIVQAAATQDAATDGVFIINEGYTVTIQDLTIQNGNADPANGTSSVNDGGGIWIDFNATSDISLINLNITNNYSDDKGGGIYTIGGDGTLSLMDCVITNNEANVSSSLADGGGISNRGAVVFTLIRCTIANNRSGDDGGGVLNIESASIAKFINCTIAGNTIGEAGVAREVDGAGIYHSGSLADMEFINCTIVENSMIGPGNGCGGGIFFRGSNLGLVNTIMANNTTKGGGLRGDDILLSGSPGEVTQTTSLVNDCYASGVGTCPDFSYTDVTNIATTPSTCGLHIYYDVTGSEAAGNATAPGGDIPADDLCGTARGGTHDIGAANVAFLPVELLFFAGNTTDDGNTLTWETASEQNNQGFSIEHSTDSKTWTVIDFQVGSGTSNQTQTYSYLHDAPKAGINYYRLRQIDYDSSYDYSDIIAINYEATGAKGELLVFPNPATNTLNYRVPDLTTVQSVQLLDLFGKQVKSVPITNGQLSLADVPSGSYMLRVETATQMWQQRVVKQ